MTGAGFTIGGKDHPISPVMLGMPSCPRNSPPSFWTKECTPSASSIPSFPRDRPASARRFLAAHTREQLDKAIEAFCKVGKNLGVISDSRAFHGFDASPCPAATCRRCPSSGWCVPLPSIPDHEVVRQIGSGAYGSMAGKILDRAWRAVKIVWRESFAKTRSLLILVCLGIAARALSKRSAAVSDFLIAFCRSGLPVPLRKL